MAALLELERVSAGYGPIEVLREISLDVGEGEMVAMIGANGAGKSTTLRCISGCLRPVRGEIRFDGRSTAGVAPHKLVGRGLSHAPEGRRIFPRLTVHENLELGAYGRRDRGAIENDLRTAYDLFPLLAQRRHQPGGTLSGGEQQMLALARAWMSRPRLLLLDEPSLGLAPRLSEKVFTVLSQWHRQGMAILLVEQNARQALALVQRAYVLEHGKISLHGLARELAADPRVQQAYLGA
ncbi:MAG TPA: ABC transporter ATP-binding protein [Pirellulales bacterium]|jgi:branched-chain amino acid transport system ATP-binding protein|nr:ABC transporter ATP-binding protein [Pirellulales bacterium]